ncbi:MAG: type II toxin-antitoxin system RelE/ParE family toxin [Thermoplasmata archaeon]|jgi:mRNA interferase RelE/StbE
MPFQIIWSESAARQLAKLDRGVAKRIFDKVEGLRDEPFRQVRRLTGLPYFRLRVGDFRVFVEVNQSDLLVLVLKVGHRESIYE